MKKVILDTNFLMIPGQFGVDVYSEIRKVVALECQICTLDRSMWELDKIVKEQKGKNKRAAELAKKIAQKLGIKVIKTDKLKNVDKILLKKAEEGVIIATQDKALQEALKRNKASLIRLRQKKYLVLEE